MWTLHRNPSYWRARFSNVILLGTTGTVQGTVFASDGSTPVVGAIVKLCPGGNWTVSKADGTFVLYDVPIGTYKFIAYNPAGTAGDSEDIEVSTDAVTEVTFVLNSSVVGCP